MPFKFTHLMLESNGDDALSLIIKKHSNEAKIKILFDIFIFGYNIYLFK